jgi:hypothetical protein
MPTRERLTGNSIMARASIPIPCHFARIRSERQLRPSRLGRSSIDCFALERETFLGRADGRRRCEHPQHVVGETRRKRRSRICDSNGREMSIGRLPAVSLNVIRRGCLR